MREQQIRLGLLKAARVLFSQQDNLQQMMVQTSESDTGSHSLFQQLLGAATRPSPIKALFGRDELEVSEQYLDIRIQLVNSFVNALINIYIIWY